MTRRCGVLLLAMGCAGAEAGPQATVRDSAGIRIVESRAPAAGAWRLTADPLLHIGTLDEDPDRQLYQVRGVARRADGTVLVANGGTHQLRLYDTTGALVWRAGRQGGGPGEFQQMGSPALLGDSAFVYDWNARRVSVFDRGGAFVRSFRPAVPDGTFPTAVMPVGDTLLLVRTGAVYGPGAQQGVRRDSATLYLLDLAGAVVDSLGPFPDFERLVIARGRGMSVTSRTFGRGLSVEVGGDRIYVGDNTTFEVRVLAPDGRLLRILRRAHTPAPVTSADIAAARARALENVEDRFRAMVEEMQDAMDYPATFPAYAAIRVDHEGQVWVAAYQADPGLARTWHVFDPAGRWVADVTTPARLTVQAIGRDWVLGTWRDEMDVEYVRLYGLDRDGR